METLNTDIFAENETTNIYEIINDVYVIKRQLDKLNNNPTECAKIYLLLDKYPKIVDSKKKTCRLFDGKKIYVDLEYIQQTTNFMITINLHPDFMMKLVLRWDDDKIIHKKIAKITNLTGFNKPLFNRLVELLNMYEFSAKVKLDNGEFYALLGRTCEGYQKIS